jgi:restriction endonuclease Mrr
MTKLPSPSELAPVVVEVIRELGGTAHFKDIEKAVLKKLDLSSEATSQVRSGKRTEFAYRLSWARTKCKSEGLITNSGSGIWKLVNI